MAKSHTWLLLKTIQFKFQFWETLEKKASKTENRDKNWKGKSLKVADATQEGAIYLLDGKILHLASLLQFDNTIQFKFLLSNS